MTIAFQRLTEGDLPRLAEWLGRPHVAEWWGAPGTIVDVRAKYLPRLTETSTVVPYFAYLDLVPVGYTHSYVPALEGGAWWPDERDLGVRGIDQFLSDGDRLGQGLGTEMVSAFVKLLFSDPTVTKIQTDPAPSNVRAIRCYERVGFRRMGTITTPDGAALLMTIERPPAQRAAPTR